MTKKRDKDKFDNNLKKDVTPIEEIIANIVSCPACGSDDNVNEVRGEDTYFECFHCDLMIENGKVTRSSTRG